MSTEFYPLQKRHTLAFERECRHLSEKIASCLNHLTFHPQSKKTIRRMVQYADTMMGDSKFLHNDLLERYSKSIINDFKTVDDVRKKHAQFEQLKHDYGIIGERHAPKIIDLLDNHFNYQKTEVN